MTMLVLTFCAAAGCCGVAALFAGVKNGRGAKLPPYILAAASFVGAVALFIISRPAAASAPLRLGAWELPGAGFVFGCDQLSLLFLVPLLILTACSALFGPRYLDHGGYSRTHWFFFSLLVAGMALVLIARNGVLFLLAWELMALSSFFLVITDHKNESSMKAGWIYFITAHIGTAFLLGLFFLLASSTGSFDFNVWKSTGIAGKVADAVFVLALVAFGLKAGFIPFHVWLPLAHPAAPSHVSALMSGIMIKMGIYGIARILTLIMPFHAWWGTVLIITGCISGVLGILFAIGQHDLKRLLAYSSVENIGIILLGFGLGIVGCASGSGPMAVFGFAGSLLHIVNHSFFKAALFLGAGSVIRQTGTGDLNRLGGLIKSMPHTAIPFLIGSAAICGLPFFNGFVSELLLYRGSIHGAIFGTQPATTLAGVAVVLSLALIGGLAVACFSKVIGIVFLGAARTKNASESREAPRSMTISMWILALLCVFIGCAGPLFVSWLTGTVAMFLPPESGFDTVAPVTFSVSVSLTLAWCAGIGLVVTLVVFAGKKWRSKAGTTVTWDCGYARPDASMQYTASSFDSPLISFFSRLVAGRRTFKGSNDLFPTTAWSFNAGVDDWILTRIFAPATGLGQRALSLLQWFQSGKSGQYILYIVITMLGLIVWKFFL